MAKLESIIKSEIKRLAKHEVRSVYRPLRKEVWGMKLKLSNLIKNFSALDRLAKEQLEKEPKKGLEATPEEVKASRLTPERIRGLRKKLGISMRELGRLTGSSLSAILSWEKGKFKPRGDKKAALVALRKVRKRDVRKMLAEKAVETKREEPPKKSSKRTKAKRLLGKRK